MKTDPIKTDFTSELTSQLPSMKEDAQRRQASEATANISRNPQYVGKGDSAKWGVEEMRAAIRDIADISEKTMINFIMLGEVGKAVRENNDLVVTDKVQVGMKANQLTPEIKSLFKTWGYEETKYGYRYFYTPDLKWDIKIPVEIHVIKKHYDFFDNPDIGFYAVDTFRIANPFDRYWKVRHLIR